MIIISFRGGCRFAITLSEQDEAKFWAIMRNKLRSIEIVMQKIIERGLIELAGELPENRR